MKIHERVTKTGPSAGQTYFMVENDGEVYASRDKVAIQVLVDKGPDSVTVERSHNNWTWVTLKDGQNSPKSNEDAPGSSQKTTDGRKLTTRVSAVITELNSILKELEG